MPPLSCLVLAGCCMKAVLEYDWGFDRWYVWEPPRWTDRLFLLNHGRTIIGSGRTREEAIEDARREIAKKGWPLPRGYTNETVEL